MSRPWPPNEDRALMVSVKNRIPIDQIASQLKRPPKSIQVRSIALRLDADYLNNKD